MHGNGLEVAHNGVRGDNVVEVNEKKVCESQHHQSDEGGRHYVSTQSYRDRSVRVGFTAG